MVEFIDYFKISFLGPSALHEICGSSFIRNAPDAEDEVKIPNY